MCFQSMIHLFAPLGIPLRDIISQLGGKKEKAIGNNIISNATSCDIMDSLSASTQKSPLVTEAIYRRTWKEL